MQNSNKKREIANFGWLLWGPDRFAKYSKSDRGKEEGINKPRMQHEIRGQQEVETRRVRGKEDGAIQVTPAKPANLFPNSSTAKGRRPPRQEDQHVRTTWCEQKNDKLKNTRRSKRWLL